MKSTRHYFRALTHPPPVLYIMGHLPGKWYCSGDTRRPSVPCLIRQVFSEAFVNGFAVVSGLARGIDQARPRPLSGWQQNRAVLGSHIGQIYPRITGD